MHGYGAVEASCRTSSMMNGGTGSSFLYVQGARYVSVQRVEAGEECMVRTWQDRQRRCMSISLWLILPQPEQCHQDRLGFPSSAWIMHQRISSNGGASPGPLAPSSTTSLSGSKAGTVSVTSDVTTVAGGGSHHGEAKFPFESAASNGGV